MKRFIFVFLLLLLLSFQALANGVPRAQCFPTEKLPPALRAKSEELLLKALDSEALYTLIGGLKPMSSGVASFKFAVKQPDLREIEEARQALAAWRCGEDLFADVRHFAQTYEDSKTKELTRAAEAVLLNLPALSATVSKYADYFAPFGLTPHAHPMEVLMAIEYSQPGLRWRGYGYLFGFPPYAVEFFVNAGESEKQTGKFVERDFLSISTFGAEKHQFVWAVPKGYVEQDEDRAIRARAAEILAAYRERRARFIGAGKPGVSELLRDWFDDGNGFCSLSNAMKPKAKAAGAKGGK